ncbi:MAG: hypothetical protein KIT31_05475 [Deltaproteobacteria bacterium]|nr:hypothetical protein [Deltaproteobacteria bacterium]
MSHDIEAAKSGRSTCATCGTKIDKGETRVAELYQDTNFGRPQYERYRGRSDARDPIQRFHHLACAVDKHPAVVATALKRPHDASLIPDRVALDKQLTAALEEERKARVAAATAKLNNPVESAASDPNLDPLLAQLADTPDDPEVVAILGDLYQQRSDPRGELIVLQLAQRTARRDRGPEVANPRGRTRTAEVEDPTSKDQVQRRDQLIAHLSPRLDPTDRSTWGLGFIRRLELGARTSSRILELAGLWTHASLRVLAELRLELPQVAEDGDVIASLASGLPRSLRVLEIGGSPHGGASLQPLLAALPRLAELTLLGRLPDASLEHPTLARIGLHGLTRVGSTGYVDHVAVPYTGLARLRPELLPGVRELAFRRWAGRDAVVTELARSRWISVVESARFDEPHLLADDQPPTLPLTAVDALRDGLAGRKLRRLELAGMTIALPVRAALTAVCDELVCPTTAVVLDANTTHVTHANKPAWGRGKIVKRHDGKLEVKFDKDVKVFKADAPFLVPAPGDD